MVTSSINSKLKLYICNNRPLLIKHLWPDLFKGITIKTSLVYIHTAAIYGQLFIVTLCIQNWFLMWSLFTNKVTNVLTEVVPYWKSGYKYIICIYLKTNYICIHSKHILCYKSTVLFCNNIHCFVNCWFK